MQRWKISESTNATYDESRGERLARLICQGKTDSEPSGAGAAAARVGAKVEYVVLYYRRARVSGGHPNCRLQRTLVTSLTAAPNFSNLVSGHLQPHFLAHTIAPYPFNECSQTPPCGQDSLFNAPSFLDTVGVLFCVLCASSCCRFCLVVPTPSERTCARLSFPLDPRLNSMSRVHACGSFNT